MTIMVKIGGVFGYLDTFEEKSLKLKVSKHDAELRKSKLEKELVKVRTQKTMYCRANLQLWTFRSGMTFVS